MTQRIGPRIGYCSAFWGGWACLAVLSAVLALTPSATAAPRPDLPVGSKVWIAPMAGFEQYLRPALAAVDLPLVFVRTRAQADFEISGISQELPSETEEGSRDVRTMRQNTTVRITCIESGETVFRHSIRTVVRTPHAPARIVYWATRSQTPAGIVATGKATAARRWVRVLQQALNDTP